MYDRLKTIAETFENPLSHGGYDKRGPSLRINLEGVGRIALQTSGFEKSVAFGLHPIEVPDFKEITEVFDLCDRLLMGEPQTNAARWIWGGHNVFFDDEERKHYRASAGSFKSFMERRSDQIDIEMNMDW